MHRLSSAFSRLTSLPKTQRKSTAQAQAAPDDVGYTAATESDPDSEAAQTELYQAPGAESSNENVLENLPPEVRRLLLSRLDLECLRTMIHASPTFYQQYALDRRYILQSSLVQTLDCLLIQAYTLRYCAAQQSIGQAVLDSYTRINSQGFPPSLDQLSIAEITGIAAFHLKLVSPVCENFVIWTRKNFSEDLDDRGARLRQVTLSDTETRRFARAIYHFELFSHLVAPGPDILGVNHEVLSGDFFRLINPWEVEELFSFYLFVKGVYEKILDDVRWDLHPDNPRFDDQRRPPTPDGAFDVDSCKLGRPCDPVSRLCEGS